MPSAIVPPFASTVLAIHRIHRRILRLPVVLLRIVLLRVPLILIPPWVTIHVCISASIAILARPRITVVVTLSLRLASATAPALALALAFSFALAPALALALVWVRTLALGFVVPRQLWFWAFGWEFCQVLALASFARSAALRSRT